MIDLIHTLSALPSIQIFELLLLVGWIAAQPMPCVCAWRAG